MKTFDDLAQFIESQFVGKEVSVKTLNPFILAACDVFKIADSSNVQIGYSFGRTFRYYQDAQKVKNCDWELIGSACADNMPLDVYKNNYMVYGAYYDNEYDTFVVMLYGNPSFLKEGNNG